MKNIKLIYGFIVVFGLSSIALSCSDDDEKTSAGFAGIASSYSENEGEVTLLIPFVNGSVSASDIIIDGSATAGEDYEVIGVTDEGIEIKLMDDDQWEAIERIRLRINNSSGNANYIHTVTLLSDNNDCEDVVGMVVTDLRGIYEVVTDDWEDYAPGDQLTIEVVDNTHVRIAEYPGTTVDHHGLVLTISDQISDVATVGIDVESQNNGSYNASGTQRVTTTGTGNLTGPCTIDLTLTMVLPCCGTNSNLSLVLQRIK